jgi:hypothetical protein
VTSPVLVIVCRAFLPSSTVCNTSSFLTQLVHLISIVLQHHISNLYRCSELLIQKRQIWTFSGKYFGAVISLSAAHSHLNLCDIYLWRTRVQEAHVYPTVIKMKRGKKFPPPQEGLAHECKRKVKPQKAFRTTPPPDTHR